MSGAGVPEPGGVPLVTVVVPARDEAADIESCLAALAAQDHPLERLEVVVVDGGSSDGTAALARRALAGVGFARAVVVENQPGSTPSNLNRGLAEARGAVLVRVDARSLVPPHYVRRCVEVLTGDDSVRVVGGAQVAVSPRADARGIGIARALNNRYGMGLSRYRRGATSGPTDTVYLGAFRTDELRAAGGWDERLSTNQDFELNRRLGATGRVWFADDLSVGYVPRASLTDLFRQYHRFGRWKVRYWTMTGDRPQPRQLALATAPLLVAVAGVALLAASPPRRRALLGVGGAVVAVGLEVRGSAGPNGGAAAHAVSLAASLAVASGWLSGVYREALAGLRGAA